MKRFVSLLLALVLIFNLGITPTAASGENPQYVLSLETPSKNAVVGTEEAPEYVYVTLKGDRDITSQVSQAVIRFDPTYLRFDQGSSNANTENNFFTAGEVNNNGYTGVSVGFASWGNDKQVKAGAWYTLAFQVLKAGTTSVNITNDSAVFVGDNLDELPTDISSTVTFSITEPSSNVPVTGVTLNKRELSLGVNDNETLTANVAPNNATNKTVTWSTSNGAVATVTDEGVVTAVSAGTATITATTNDGSHTDSCVVTVTAASVGGYYTVSMENSFVTATSGSAANVNVMVSGHSSNRINKYNDYDVYVTYDSTNLTFNKNNSSAADVGATIDETATGTIRITGHGTAKEFSKAVATLNFTANASGAYKVRITSAKVDNSGNAIDNNAPEASVATSTTDIKVPYSVTLPTDKGFSSDQSSVLPGNSFSFTAPSDAAYYDITVTVGGSIVTPDISGSTYTISDVNGDVVVSAAGKDYNVIVKNGGATFNGKNTARYGEDYSFSVTASDGYRIKGITATVNGSTVPMSSTGNSYIIEGDKIKGDVSITIEQERIGSAEVTTNVTFTGISEDEIVGGLTQTATVGQPFTFRLNKQSGVIYAVKIGDTKITPNEDGIYTIPGLLVTSGGVTVDIEKPSLTVSVHNYITLSSKNIWLITATAENNVLAYGEEGTMFWSDKYNAYCWLVISGDNESTVKTAALAAITEAAGNAAAVKVAYDGDVNQTSDVDINDAQLTYDMYNAHYGDFESVGMDKFLEADMNGSKHVNTEDAVAIVNKILK